MSNNAAIGGPYQYKSQQEMADLARGGTGNYRGFNPWFDHPSPIAKWAIRNNLWKPA